MQLRVQPSPGQCSLHRDRTAPVSCKRRLRGMPRACWSSQYRSGRSQSRSSSFTLQFRWRTGCRVRRHWDQPDHHPDGLQPNDPLPVPISTDNVYGVVSLIFWSVMIIVTLTYVTLVMRADNDGGGKSWRSSRCCGGTAGRGVVAPPGRWPRWALRRRTVPRREHDHPLRSRPGPIGTA
jgi:hypothetical protein